MTLGLIWYFWLWTLLVWMSHVKNRQIPISKCLLWPCRHSTLDILNRKNECNLFYLKSLTIEMQRNNLNNIYNINMKYIELSIKVQGLNVTFISAWSYSAFITLVLITWILRNKLMMAAMFLLIVTCRYFKWMSLDLWLQTSRITIFET